MYSSNNPTNKLDYRQNLMFTVFSKRIELHVGGCYFKYHFPGLDKAKKNAFSLELAIKPGYFIRQKNFGLFLDPDDGTQHFSECFEFVPPLCTFFAVI